MDTLTENTALTDKESFNTQSPWEEDAVEGES
jgi:hypothetical protein